MTVPPQEERDAAAVRTPAAAQAHNLARRVASAAVLVPLAIATAYFGGWLFFAAWLLASGAILWEWTILVQRNADMRVLLPGWAALIGAMALAGERQAAAAAGAIVFGALLAGGAVAAIPRQSAASAMPLWAGTGVVYAGISLLGPVL